jgi:divalent metal cation (Fe/Co/Zn/Cd) transporter
MNSAALLAEAGHSLSDLLGDFVTLFAWKFSRVPPSGELDLFIPYLIGPDLRAKEKYPYGRGKFEALGSTAISLLLVGGALGIAFHSTHMLSHALEATIPTMQPGAAQSALQAIVNISNHLPEIGHSHGHGSVLDPNAAWFAAVSVVAKEWLYR